jgi:hypothetical protein
MALLSLVIPSYATTNVMVAAIHHAFGHYPFADPFLHELFSSSREGENNTKAVVTQEKEVCNRTDGWIAPTQAPWLSRPCSVGLRDRLSGCYFSLG